ncbi:MAG: AAA family ATPase [Chloroflexota bacterium]
MPENHKTPKEFAVAKMQSIQEEMKDLDEIVRLCLVALYAKGHVLLEGNPGLGKTALVNTLGKTLAFEAGRIQFTPDLMPSDITGTMMPAESNGQGFRLEFQEGPIFTSLLLADEINRATPKTQSAMLEAMAEEQVTVLGTQWALPKPFMVLATQNPIDHEGTYTLPEAQTDRFMFKLLMPTPKATTLSKIMEKEANRLARSAQEMGKEQKNMKMETGSVVDAIKEQQKSARERCYAYRSSIGSIDLIPSSQRHILNLVLATNQQFDELDSLNKANKSPKLDIRSIRTLTEKVMRYGLGPRAATALMLGAKAWSFFFASPENEQADGFDLARVILPALRHRLRLGYDWVDKYRPQSEPEDVDENALLDELIAELAILTAPNLDGYQNTFEREMKRVLSKEYGGA